MPRAPRRASLEGLPPLIKVMKAAEILGWSRSAAYRKANAGHLPVLRMGGQLWVVTAEFRRMLGQ